MPITYLFSWPLSFKDSLEKLQSEECLSVVESLAALASVDISEIETHHASNRECALMRARGWVTTLGFVSSTFVCRNFESNSFICFVDRQVL